MISLGSAKHMKNPFKNEDFFLVYTNKVSAVDKLQMLFSLPFTYIPFPLESHKGVEMLIVSWTSAIP